MHARTGRSTLIGIMSLALVQCGGDDRRHAGGDAAQRSDPAAPNVSTTSDGSTAPALSVSDIGRVCRAAVAALNGHKPAIMKVVSTEGGLVRVRYSRPSDGKVWTNECRIDGERVIWRTVDAFGAGSGAGRWRTDPADETVTYKLEGPTVQITTSYSDGSASTESYTVR